MEQLPVFLTTPQGVRREIRQNRWRKPTARLAAGIPVRHLEEGCNVPMYLSSIECVPAGLFQGSMVVSFVVPGQGASIWR